MAGFHTKTFAKHDSYMTPKSAWENIKEYIPKDKVIWEAFYGGMIKSESSHAETRGKHAGSTLPQHRMGPTLPNFSPARPLELEVDDDEYADNFSGPAFMLTALKEAIVSTKEEKTGSFLSSEAASLITSGLAKPMRAEYIQTVLNQSILIDARVEQLKCITAWVSEKDLDDRLALLHLVNVDKRLAATIYQTLDSKSPTVKLLLKATVSKPKLGISGVRIIDWIKKDGAKGSYGEHKKEKQTFDEKMFFTAGVSADENKVAGGNLLLEIDALPASYTMHKHAKLEMILEKIPFHLKDSTWADRLRTDFHMKTAGGTDSEAPWSPEELINLISSFLSLEPVLVAPVVRKATLQKPKPNLDGDGGERAKRYGGKILYGTAGFQHDAKSGKGTYCFINIDSDTGDDTFCHSNDVKGGALKEGDRVQFKLVSNRGKDKAVDVSRIDEAASPPPTSPPPLVNAALTQTEDEEEAYEAPYMRINVVR